MKPSWSIWCRRRSPNIDTTYNQTPRVVAFSTALYAGRCSKSLRLRPDQLSLLAPARAKTIDRDGVARTSNIGQHKAPLRTRQLSAFDYKWYRCLDSDDGTRSTSWVSSWLARKNRERRRYVIFWKNIRALAWATRRKCISSITTLCFLVRSIINCCTAISQGWQDRQSRVNAPRATCMGNQRRSGFGITTRKSNCSFSCEIQSSAPLPIGTCNDSRGASRFDRKS